MASRDPVSSASTPAKARPPPLPPRASSSYLAPPPYSEMPEDLQQGLLSEQWRSNDPRSSSMHSLVPPESARAGRRTLLLIFVHGFMGNETSFQSFPAHLHNLLTLSMSETHVVHTKIYPRYKSRRDIAFAAEDFSTWLEPHESPHTDVVLLGHSMGGILIADVVLLRPRSLTSDLPARHRIIGTINFDTPFLGMHPGLVISGISSLFRPAPVMPPAANETHGSLSPGLHHTSAAQSTTSVSTEPWLDSNSAMSSSSISQASTGASSSDPNYNPPFANDVRIKEKSGLSSLLHFVNKHSDNLSRATGQYFMSHIEFGGCMADFPGLKRRYNSVRALEDVADNAAPSHQKPVARVRFVNYYTASTGIPKKPKVKNENSDPADGAMQDLSLSESNSHSGTSSVISSNDGQTTPKASESEVHFLNPIKTQMENLGADSGVHEARESIEVYHDEEDSDDGKGTPPMRHIDSMPIMESDDDEEFHIAEESVSPVQNADSLSAEGNDTSDSISTDTSNLPIPTPTSEARAALPPIPPLPTEPAPLDLTQYPDKDLRKLAEKEHKNVTKAYAKSVKDRETAIKDRAKLVAKREKKRAQEVERANKEAEKARLKAEKEEKKRKDAQQKEEMKEWKEREEEERLEAERTAAATAAATAALSTSSPPPSNGNPTTPTRSASTSASKTEPTTSSKPAKDRKFCILPTDIWNLHGEKDDCWVRIYMQGVDEVGAHCGLFFQGPQYESLVGDVGERIREWVVQGVVVCGDGDSR